jgi:hypothetical protein
LISGETSQDQRSVVAQLWLRPIHVVNPCRQTGHMSKPSAFAPNCARPHAAPRTARQGPDARERRPRNPAFLLARTWRFPQKAPASRLRGYRSSAAANHAHPLPRRDAHRLSATAAGHLARVTAFSVSRPMPSCNAVSQLSALSRHSSLVQHDLGRRHEGRKAV